MVLENLSWSAPTVELPAAVHALLREADRRTEVFLNRTTFQPPGGFLAGDYALVYSALRQLEATEGAAGKVFCEWGSGFGVITLLAATLGFRAFGIEVQEELVEEAQGLAEWAELSVEFAAGTFVPADAAPQAGDEEGPSFLDNAGPDGHELLGLSPTELDVVYCFPWPHEELLVERLFEECAAPGALYLTDRGDEQLVAFRKR